MGPATNSTQQDEPQSECTLVVLGGNAFARPGEPLTMAGQFAFAEALFQRLVPLFEDGRRIIITHGNGPQVGQMLTRVEAALGEAYALPLEVCVAESEGELGYVLQQSLLNVLREHGLDRPVVSVLTQVVVDADDPAFASPAKPVGVFYSTEQAQQLQREGFTLREDAGRGFRRVVASPAPQAIIEADVIRQLIHSGVIVVAAGGGGIPVVERDARLVGVEAVIDKDHASTLLGELIDADEMLIVTGVPSAYRNFGAADQTPIGRISPDAAERLVSAGHFAAGSMMPKMEAAIRFARRPGCRAVICNIDSLPSAIAGHSGTIVEQRTEDGDDT
ncbi:MAG: carbamate kinase [Planctomycetota bacterium]|jgi:carbamate kinase